MRGWITTAIEVSGFGAISAAGYMVDVALGTAVAGVCLVTIGALLGRGES